MNRSWFRLSRLGSRLPASMTLLFWSVVFVVMTFIYEPNLQHHFKRALDPKFVNDDVRQQLFTFFRFADARLFKNDYISDYYFAILPVLFRAGYVVAAWFNEIVFVSKVIPYLLLAIIVVAVTLAAHRLSGKVGAVTAMALILGNQLYLQRLSGGLPRSFAFPIVSLMILTLVTGRAYSLAILTCVAAGFYPVTSLICGSCLSAWLVLLPARARGQAEKWSLERRLIVLMGTAIGSLLVLLPQILGTRKYGGIIGVAQLDEFPEIGPLGRYISEDRAPFPSLIAALRNTLEHSLFGSGEPWSESFRNWSMTTTGLSPKVVTIGLTVLSVGIWLARSSRCKELLRVLLVPVSVMLGYVGACQYAPHLFLPQRYVVYTVPIIVVLFISTAGGLAIDFLRVKSVVRQLIAALVYVPLLLLVGGRGTKDEGLATVLRSKDALMLAVRKLPPSALVAAWPNGIANDIPYVARRRIFVSKETHQAFHREYTLEMRRRVLALIDAYSTTNVEPLIRLYREYGVTHLVVQGEFFEGTVPHYFRPFNSAIEEASRRLDGQMPITRSLEASTSVFRHRNTAILSLERLAEER